MALAHIILGKHYFSVWPTNGSSQWIMVTSLVCHWFPQSIWSNKSWNPNQETRALWCWGNVLQWFSSFLKDRKQRVSIGSSLSDVLPMLNGVPQGSCLGPLLFLLYLNDIPFGNSSTSTHLYVDDTTLPYHSPSVTQLNINLQRRANALSFWATSNKMLIHPQKSKILILGSQLKLEGTEEYLNVKISGKTVEQSHREKVLGVHFRLLSD